MSADTSRGEVSWAHGVGRQLVLFVVTVATLYPVLWVVGISLSADAGFGGGVWPWPRPDELTLEHYGRVVGATDALGEPVFFRQLANSVIVSLATTVVGIGLSTTAAWGFSRFRFPGREPALQAFLITQMFPGVVMAIPLYLLLDRLGLLDSLLGLTLVYAVTAVPFCVWMLKGYFDTIPRDIEEAAIMDGASQWTIFTRIVLPLARPAVVVTALFSFMTAWNEFILAATFLNDERHVTLPVALQRHVDSFSTDWGAFAAGAVLVSVPVMLLFFLLQKHLVGGLTAGGVKG